MRETYNHPPLGFYFGLSISGKTKESPATFKEASGIKAELNVGEMEEGENSFKFKVPTGPKYENLVLRKGVVPKDSAIIKWCMETLSKGVTNSIETKTISLRLVDDKGNSLKEWIFKDAWPVRADSGAMNADILMVESLEFAYTSFRLT